MKTFSKQSKKLRKFFHSAPLPRVILWILTLAFPIYMTLVANYISFGSRSMLSTLITAQTGAFVLGLLLVYGVYFTFVFLFRRFSTAAGITGFLFILLPLIDHFKSVILQDHFYPWDLTLAQNAGSFTEFLGSISFPWQYILLFVVTILYWLFLHVTRPMLPIRSKVHFVGVPVLAALLVVFVTNTTVRGCYEPLFGIVINEETDQDYIYDNYGFLTGFALNFGTVDTLMPQDYSEEVMAEMFAPFVPTGEEDTSDFENPDVIVVLSEAFWDPTKLEGVTFSEDPLKNYRAIAAEHPSGEMVSCTFGGGTIRPEFEIQSGMSTSTLPSGNMPYQQYLKEKTFAYAQLFKSLGYDTLGVHTYQKTFYERDRAYPLMGYDDFLGENDMHAELHWNSGPYITDQTIAEEIIYQLEQPHETGLYLTAITMENHSLYTDKFDSSDWDIKVSGDNLSEQEVISLQNYAKGVSDSDAALGMLYDYIMQREKPTVLLWYGDHLPTLGDNFTPYTSTGTIHADKAAEWTEEEKYTMFCTPYVMFANYDTGNDYRAEDQQVSPYLLPALLCDYINAPACLQTNFLLHVFETCPVMSSYYNLYSPESTPEEREEIQKLHRYLTYDELIGEKYLDKMQGFEF